MHYSTHALTAFFECSVVVESTKKYSQARIFGTRFVIEFENRKLSDILMDPF